MFICDVHRHHRHRMNGHHRRLRSRRMSDYRQSLRWNRKSVKIRHYLNGLLKVNSYELLHCYEKQSHCSNGYSFRCLKNGMHLFVLHHL